MLNLLAAIVEQVAPASPQSPAPLVPLDSELLKQVSGGEDYGPHDNW